VFSSRIRFTASLRLFVVRQKSFDSVDQRVHCERLADVIVDAQLFSVNPMAVAFIPGDHDDPNRVFPATSQRFQDKESAPLGHHHVEDHQVRIASLDHGQALIAVFREEDLVTVGLEGESHRLQDVAIVIDQQDSFGGCFVRLAHTHFTRTLGTPLARRIDAPAHSCESLTIMTEYRLSCNRELWEGIPMFLGDGAPVFVAEAARLWLELKEYFAKRLRVQLRQKGTDEETSPPMQGVPENGPPRLASAGAVW
jgi:hypothetical protein